MSFADLRDHLDRLREEDELVTLRGVDPVEEIGGLTELTLREDDPPALLFDDVEGYEPGFRLLTNATATPYLYALAAGLPPSTERRAVVKAQRDHANVTDPIAPEVVDSGPVLENVRRGGEVDVTRFPAPKWHAHDGGRFLGTGDVVITEHRESGETNAGCYRIQVHDEDRVTCYMGPGRDGRANMNSYLDRGEPAPIVMSVGQPVDLFLGATQRLPPDADELAYVGALRGEPVEVIEGEATGLPIPAAAEVVLEGHVYPDSEAVAEGPFGEFTGYYGGTGHTDRPVTVERAYHRDDPIVLGKPPLRPPAQAMTDVRMAARLWNELDDSGIPGIRAANVMPFGPGFFDVVSIEQQYAGHARQAGLHAMSSPSKSVFGRFTVVVDDDVDAYDQGEVLWALSTRVDPAEDVQIVEAQGSSTLDPTVTGEQKAAGDLTSSRALVDATRPYHRRDEYAEVVEMREGLEAELREKYRDELFADDRA